MTAAHPVDRRVRAGEPEFAREADAARWRTARRAALDHLLAVIAGAWWSDNLVLRGSMLLHAWLPDTAREPGDLDWVVCSPPEYSYLYGDLRDLVRAWPAMETEESHGPDTQTIPALPSSGLDDVDDWWLDQVSTEDHPYDDLVDRLRRRPTAAGGVLLDAEGTVFDDLWSCQEYHLPGVRLTIPWRLAGLPAGTVQVDFAHDESVPGMPLATLMPRADGRGPTVVHTAGREASLAWKLLWLRHDSETRGTVQGKDLYDAALLGEDPHTDLSRPLLAEVLNQGGHEVADVSPDRVRSWNVAWDQFHAEYPWVQGTAAEWLGRLGDALEPVFTRTRTTAADFRVGDSVTVTEGAFAQLPGTITRIEPNGRVQLSVSIFGRETPVALSSEQISRH